MMPTSSAVILHILALFSYIIPSHGQSVVTVEVGNQGLFFTPSTVTAAQGDVVSFVFVGKNHSVTQSTFDDPCTPLDGGFNSGLAGVGADDTSPPPVWNLTITDDSQPIWYFCEVEEPASHCISGMVGAINPPSRDDFEEFLSAAKAVEVTPSPTDTIALTGVGAEATEPPTVTASGTSTSTGASRTTAVSTPAPSTSSSTSAFFTKPSTTSTGSNNGPNSSSRGSKIPSLGLISIIVLLRMLLMFAL